MKKRLRHQTEEATDEDHEAAHAPFSHAHTAAEFSSVEELLRHDAAQTPVPPELGARVRHSLAREAASAPPASLPWWKRWLPR